MMGDMMWLAGWLVSNPPSYPPPLAHHYADCRGISKSKYGRIYLLHNAKILLGNSSGAQHQHQQPGTTPPTPYTALIIGNVAAGEI